MLQTYWYMLKNIFQIMFYHNTSQACSNQLLFSLVKSGLFWRILFLSYMAINWMPELVWEVMNFAPFTIRFGSQVYGKADKVVFHLIYLIELNYSNLAI